MLILALVFFGITFVWAQMSKNIHRMTVTLSQLQWQFNGWPFRVKMKIKLMTYFERLSAKKKIGFTISSTITLTHHIFAMVTLDSST